MRTSWVLLPKEGEFSIEQRSLMVIAGIPNFQQNNRDHPTTAIPMPPNPSLPRHMMYRPVPSPIKPCQTSSRRAAGEAPIGWNSSKTSPSDTKWRTWKSPDQDEDPASNSNSNNNNSDDDDCKSTPTISTAADTPMSHGPRTPSPKNPSITGASPKCVLLQDTTSPHLSSASIVANRQDDPQQHKLQQQQQQSSSSPSPPQLELPALTAPDEMTTDENTAFQNDQIGAHHPQVTETSDAHVTTTTPNACDGNRNPTIRVDSTHDDRGSASLQQSNNNKSNYPASPTLKNNDNDDDSDDIEKERRRQARALEQQERILRQVEALRQLKRNKNQNKHHQKEQPAHVLTRDEVASNPPSIGKTNPTSETSSTLAATYSDNNKSKVRSSHADNRSHDHDAKRAAATRAVHRPDRPPRTKGLLYQRQANGSLVRIDRPIGRPSHLN